MGLDTWEIEVRFDERQHQATCYAWPDYEEALIKFNLPQIWRDSRAPRALEDLVLHELSHCLIWDGRKSAPAERTATRVARAIIRASRMRR